MLLLMYLFKTNGRIFVLKKNIVYVIKTCNLMYMVNDILYVLEIVGILVGKKLEMSG
mgnify:CR=1 FL=1